MLEFADHQRLGVDGKAQINKGDHVIVSSGGQVLEWKCGGRMPQHTLPFFWPCK